jgi:uncharacterized protein YegL
MSGPRISELNAGLGAYKEELMSDSLAAKRVEVAVVTFGGEVTTVVDFTTAESFTPPTLEPNANTPMGAAINRAIEMITDRKATYRANGIAFYRPWIFMITDGAPPDDYSSTYDLYVAVHRFQQGEKIKSFSFFAVGVEGADFNVLGQIATRQPLKLKGLRFRDLFQWLSNSQQSVSRSTPGDDVPLSNPAGPDGWASV